MPAFDFSIKEGTTRRILLTGLDANGDPYDYTGTTVELIVKAKTGDATPVIDFSLTVDGTGVGTSDPANRMFLGRPNPADLDGALIDTAATSGYITVRFAPADTLPLVTTASKAFLYAARVVAGDDTYPLQEGTITVEDSLFDN